MEIFVTDAELRAAAAEGGEAFVLLIKQRISAAVNDELDANAMQQLNAEQMTLWGYFILRDEVMDGGFLQLIYNGYGAFFFRNPFAKAMRMWGIEGMPALIRRAERLYDRHKDEIMKERSDEDFMAMFEQYPEFDALDDEFVEHEEEWTMKVARYVDENLSQFVTVVE